jgi:hypothetical protein
MPLVNDLMTASTTEPVTVSNAEKAVLDADIVANHGFKPDEVDKMALARINKNIDKGEDSVISLVRLG